jgi:hypothetical protein
LFITNRMFLGSCPSISYIDDPFDASTFLDSIFDIREDIVSLQPIADYLKTNNEALVYKSYVGLFSFISRSFNLLISFKTTYFSEQNSSSSFHKTNRLNLLLLSIYLATTTTSLPTCAQDIVKLILDQVCKMNDSFFT